MNKRKIAKFCLDVFEKTVIICAAIALYMTLGPVKSHATERDSRCNQQPDQTPQHYIEANDTRPYNSVKMTTHVTIETPVDPEPQLPPEENEEPQLPPEDIEPELPQEPELPETQILSEPKPAYPVRDDLIDAGNTLSHEYQIVMQEACAEYTRVSYAMALAVCDIESDFNKNAKSSTNDIGFMQINEINRAQLAKLGFDIDDPVDNIKAGIYLLDGHMAATNNDTSKALMRYNNGAGGAAKLWKQGVYETDYTRKVTKAITKYEELLRS